MCGILLNCNERKLWKVLVFVYWCSLDLNSGSRWSVVTQLFSKMSSTSRTCYFIGKWFTGIFVSAQFLNFRKAVIIEITKDCSPSGAIVGTGGVQRRSLWKYYFQTESGEHHGHTVIDHEEGLSKRRNNWCHALNTPIFFWKMRKVLSKPIFIWRKIELFSGLFF